MTEPKIYLIRLVQEAYCMPFISEPSSSPPSSTSIHLSGLLALPSVAVVLHMIIHVLLQEPSRTILTLNLLLILSVFLLHFLDGDAF